MKTQANCISRIALILMSTAAFSAYAYKTVKSDAEIACAKTLNYALHERKIPNGTYETLFPLCKYTPKSKAQWACLKQGLQNSNSFRFSEAQCFKKPGTGEILIGKGEEENAAKACLKVAQFLKNNGRKDQGSILSGDCNLGRNTQEWACMSNMIENKHNSMVSALNQCMRN